MAFVYVINIRSVGVRLLPLPADQLLEWVIVLQSTFSSGCAWYRSSVYLLEWDKAVGNCNTRPHRF